MDLDDLVDFDASSAGIKDPPSVQDNTVNSEFGANTWNTTRESKITPTKKVDLFTSGAYDNLNTVSTLFTSNIAPPPKVVSTAPKYKLFRAPLDLDELQLYCFQQKGRSKNQFCLRKNCKIAHQGDHFIMPVVPGEGYIAKDKDSAFGEPHIDFKWMDDKLISEWMASSNTLEGWIELISIADDKIKETSDDEDADLVISIEAFDEQIEKKSKILNFKTPKDKKKTSETSETDDISLDTEDPIEDTDNYKLSPLPFRTLYKMLDKRIKHVRDAVRLLASWKQSESIFTAKLSTHVEAMFGFFKRSIGTKPSNFSPDFDGSSIWIVIENMIKRLTNFDFEIKNEISRTSSGIVAEQVATKKSLNIEITDRKFESRKLLNLSKECIARVDGVEKFTVTGLELLKQQIDVLNSNLKSVKASNLNSKSTSKDLNELHQTLEDLKTTVQNIKNSNDGNSIKFGGLGFLSGFDAGAWTEVNVGPKGYGWIYDYHILMQAVW